MRLLVYGILYSGNIGDLRGHEREFVIDTTLDDFGVDNEAGGDVVFRELVIVSRCLWLLHTQENETSIGREIELGNADTTDGAVVLVIVRKEFFGEGVLPYQRTLEPLRGVGV